METTRRRPLQHFFVMPESGENISGETGNEAGSSLDSDSESTSSANEDDVDNIYGEVGPYHADEDLGQTVSEDSGGENFSPDFTEIITYDESDADLSEHNDTISQSDGRGVREDDYDGIDVPSEDDSSIAKEEERMLMQDLQRNGHNSQLRDSTPAEVSGDDGESFDSSSSEDFLDDFFEPTTPTWRRNRNATQHLRPRASEDDDSYLWQYFFSSSSEPEEEDETRQPQPEPAVREHSGDSTDEDNNRPPPSKRAQCSRAVEVLRGDSFNNRPPVLGSWNIQNSKGNFGIIDGLTTRTLSPPMRPQKYQTPTTNQSQYQDNDLWHHSDSDVSDVALDEFINTDQFDSDGDDREDTDIPRKPFIYKNRANKGVPLFAFRNRSSPYHQQSPYNEGRRTRRRSTIGGREAVISSVRSIRRRAKRVRGAQKRQQSEWDNNPANVDLLQELFDGGAITPLFEI